MRAPRFVIAAVAATGCYGQTDVGGEWEDVTATTSALVPEVGPQITASAAHACTLRVASWNVHYGEDVAGLADKLRASTEIGRADVLLVQEIEAYPDEPGSRASRFAKELGMTWIYVPAREEGDGTHGIAILSKLPLEAAKVRQLPYFDQPLRPRNRVAMSAEVVAGAVRVPVINVHLDVRLGPADRVRQLHPAINDIADAAVFGGDFNTNPWAWVESIVPLTSTEAIVGQEQAEVIDDYMTENGFASAIALDQKTVRMVADIGMRVDNLYARELPIVGAGVEHVDGSDHWPIYVDVNVCPAD